MAATYQPIATQTLTSSASSITFSSIAASWTDLRVVIANAFTSYGLDTCMIRFNGDTATNYSYTYLLGDGSTATSGATANAAQAVLGRVGVTGTPAMIQTDIFSYAASSYKTYLSAGAADQNGSGEVNRTVGLWRSTAAITSITLRNVTFEAGTTATLYGIKAIQTMANTYTLISSQILTSSAASVTFSSIPATYTDLVLSMSIRDTNTSAVIGSTTTTFNSDTTTLYSVTNLFGDGATATSSRQSGVASWSSNYNGSHANVTVSTFSSIEIYIPNYTSTTSKAFSESQAVENNAASTGAQLGARARLYRNTSAISSIEIAAYQNFQTASSFYLYGIKNS